jgi:transcription elongation factor Elf1
MDKNFEFQILPEGIIKTSNFKFNCIFCKFEINGLIPLNQHINGKYHLKNLNKSQTFLENSKLDSNIKELGNSKFECLICNLEINGPITLKQHLNGKNHLKKENNRFDILIEKSKLDSNIKELKNSKFECLICNLEINGSITLEQHLNGKNHLKNINKSQILIEKLDSSIRELGNSKFECLICNLEINGPITLKQHLNGKNHLKNIKCSLISNNFLN